MVACSTDAQRPASPEELAEALGQAGSQARTVQLRGNFSKRLMGGPLTPAEVILSTAAMKRVRQYEPRDLTISVEAGISFAELRQLLAENHQMLPLDPPFSDTATIGGILATNGSGPRRRQYGTARDLVIGMQFATLEGKLVQSGGMVVKNVAGLDMAKLMIGSFGTLAAIAVVNFKVLPLPPVESTFVFSCKGAEEAFAARDAILKSALHPAALDLLNGAATEAAHPGYVLAIKAAGNTAAIERAGRELAAMGAWPMPAAEGAVFWNAVQNFTPRYLDSHAEGAVVRVSCTLRALRGVFEPAPGPAIARAGSGVCYVYFEKASEAAHWAAGIPREHSSAVIEFAPDKEKEGLDLWPAPGPDLEMMQRVKHLLDPKGLLNRGRLYGRI